MKENIEKLTKERQRKIELMQTRVVYDSPAIRYFIENQLAQEKLLPDLVRIFEVFSGSDLWTTDEQWAVLDFRDCLWVVPNMTPIDLIYPDWSDWLIKSRGYYRAYIGGIPKAWARRPVLGMRFGRKPRPAIFQGNSLPEWQIEGPLDPRVSPPIPLQC